MPREPRPQSYAAQAARILANNPDPAARHIARALDALVSGVSPQEALGFTPEDVTRDARQERDQALRDLAGYLCGGDGAREQARVVHAAVIDHLRDPEAATGSLREYLERVAGPIRAGRVAMVRPDHLRRNVLRSIG